MHLPRRQQALAAAVAAVLVAGAATTLAAPAAGASCAPKAWTGPAGGSWSTDANWSPAGRPQAGDAVSIGAGVTVEGASGSVCGLDLAGSLGVTGTVTVTGRLAAKTGSAFTFADAAGLTISGTGSFEDKVALRRPADSAGVTPQVRVSGPTTLAGTTSTDRVGLVLGAGGTLTSGSVAGGLAGTGTLSWQGGSLGGVLTVATPLSVSSGTDMPVQPSSVLTLAGVTTLSSTRVVLAPQARVTVSGVAYLSGAPVGFVRSGAAHEGQLLTVSAGGALQRVGGTAPTPAVLDLPVVNHGAVTVSGGLDVPMGYTQRLQEGAETEPVTGLLSASSALRAVNAAGGYTTVRILGGGVGGVGSIATRKLSLGDAWVHPGFASSAGTLTVYGDLALSDESEVQLYVRGAEADKRDVLEVQGLASNGSRVAAGRATLAGSIAALTGPDYSPKYGTRATGVIRYAARTGAFGPVRPITPSGLGWRPSYDDSTKDGDGRAVDIRLMDVQPPTVGSAGVPAFTQRTVQQLTYEAVDNRSRVKSFDVRWRKGSPTRKFTEWRSPRSWRTTKDRSQVLRGLDAGWTYCLAIRARDRLGNVSEWTQPQCVTRMVDDRALKASAGWSRLREATGLYGGSASRSTTKGATLVEKGTYSRVAVSVLRCPSCGTLRVNAGKTVLKTLDLKAKRTRVTTWVSKVRKPTKAPLRLTVTSKGRPVVVDSFGLSR